MRKREQIYDILSAPRIEEGVRLCDAPECSNEGKYRAPKSKKKLNNYFWFCLEHVRAYNARWNFNAGLSQAEIEKQLRADTTWWRPSWPLGTKTSGCEIPSIDFGIFAADDWGRGSKRGVNRHKVGWRPRPGSIEEEALAILDLRAPITKGEIKERYKNLVKKNHPDTNGGDRKAEEKLKTINRAYSNLMACNEIQDQIRS